MKFEIVEIEELSGQQGKIYSVFIEDRELTLFDEFVEENNEQYPHEVREILDRLQAMGNEVGFRYDFFKHNEGRPGDGVCALYDIPDRQLRLYCIKFGGIAIILGSGGEKKVRAWQDDDKLKTNAQLMIEISKLINLRIAQKELSLTPEGLVGNLIWEDEEYE